MKNFTALFVSQSESVRTRAITVAFWSARVQMSLGKFPHQSADYRPTARRKHVATGSKRYILRRIHRSSADFPADLRFT